MTHATTVADELRRMIDATGKSQREIAAAVGYERPNVVSMMVKGQTKVPLPKAPAFAEACGADPIAFTSLVMSEYHPEAWEVLRVVFGPPHRAA